MPQTPQTDQQLLQLVQRLDPQAKLVRAWSLKGGISAQVTALEVTRSGETEKWVVRQHGAADLRSNPHIAADEFKLLRLVQAAGIPAPKAYGFDESGEILPSPYIVVEFVEGETEFAPLDLDDFLGQFAAALAQIHQVDGTNQELSFLPQIKQRQGGKLRQRPDQLDESLSEGRIREALADVWPLEQRNKPVLLHGDYWPGNLLWKAGKIAAVIDWEDALIGDPLADLGITRLEILWTFGGEALEQFMDCYRTLMPELDYANLPYWDLCAALRPAGKISLWAGDAEAERRMREGHAKFIGEAFEKLAKKNRA